MELAWMDNVDFRGPRILKQNPSGPVWDMTQFPTTTPQAVQIIAIAV